jgi:hypothetical protein
VSFGYLIAHVVSASDEPRIEFEVAYRDGDEWYTNEHHRVWPFWNMDLYDLSLDELQIPEGWIEHLHEEAIKYAAAHAPPKAARPEFLKNLLRKPAQLVERRGL